MRPTIRILKLLAASGAALTMACSNSNEPPSLTGSYTATTFTVTPTGQGAINVLAQGGSLTITIGADKATTGSLFEPASVTGGTAVQASMVGTVIQAGSKVNFNQNADTFVRNLNWLVVGSTLQVTDQPAGSANFTIVLTRQ